MRKLITKHFPTLKNYFFRGSQTVFKQGINFLIFIIAAKFLAPDVFGVYNYLFALITIFVLFGDFGVSTATSKFVAEVCDHDRCKSSRILYNSIIVITIFSLFIVLLVFCFGKKYLNQYYQLFLYLLPLIWLIPMCSLFDGYYRGLKKFQVLFYATLISGLVSIGIIYYLISKYQMVGVLLSQNIYYLILLISLIINNQYQKLSFDAKAAGQIIRYSFIIGISSLSYFLYSKADILILERFGYIKEIGYYEIINQTFMFGVLPFSILAQVIAPNIARIHAKQEYRTLYQKFIKNFLFVLTAGIVFSIICYLLIPIAYSILLKNYDIVFLKTCLQILIFLLPVKIWGVYQTQAFVVQTGDASVVAWVTMIAGILNVVLDIIFIAWLGFIGVFWVTLFIHFISIVVVSFLYLRKISKLNFQSIKINL